MDRTQFDNDPDVGDFVAWMGRFETDEEGHLRPVDGSGAGWPPAHDGGDGAPHHGAGIDVARAATPNTLRPFLPVTLAIGPSKWTPTPIAGTYPLHALTRVYCWRADGMQRGDFKETRLAIDAMSKALWNAPNDQDAASACDAILAWGGERNRMTGARAFLGALPKLSTYLDDVKKELALNAAMVPLGASSKVRAMNSMLSKVHAFNAGDGLPIYDSRVAGAIATVVETWRQQTRSGQALPAALTFPAVGAGGARRHVHRRYPGCPDPGTVHYVPRSSPARAVQAAWCWSTAKVRLGWLLSKLLVNPSAAGARSLEACLFMAGYDCKGINVP